jgi:outer membrane protein assembly factor BamD
MFKKSTCCFPWFIALAASSCSEFNKAVKSTDKHYKYREGGGVFQQAGLRPGHAVAGGIAGPYARGDTLFEPVSYLLRKRLLTARRTTSLASYYLENFAKTFPNSVHAEECSFLAAYCHFKESPEYELDQTDTQMAIDKMELFMVRFPETNLKDSCNNLIDGLRLKLEKKDYASAYQYLHTRNYRSASLAFADFLKKWPNSDRREDAYFNILEADHDLAVNSVESKKAERAEAGIRSFNTFADAFPESKRMPQARAMLRDLNAQLQTNTRSQYPMNTKFQTAAKTTVTRNVDQLDKETGNIYESIAILGKRANQVAVEIKAELQEKLEEFAVVGENIEEVYENHEQIQMSKEFERMPKPAAIAIEEMLEDRIVFRRPGAEQPTDI